MMNAEAAGEVAWESAARRYGALAQPIRLRLLDALSPVPTTLTVTQIADRLGLSVAAASRHTALLSAHGFVERQRTGMQLACRLTGAGETVLQHVRAAPCAAGHGGHDVAIEPPELAEEDAQIVALYLSLGASRLRYGGPDRDDWDDYMVREFGEAVRPHLDVLRTAVLRIARQEPFDGLPLPDEVLLNEVGEYSGFAWREADAVPFL
ncbi:MAG TPA: helix-turn-helix domain-containing protein [Longimicrobiales bacterium]|nr:helix-turn-helix domain-containing protein [Longimicrobiales bacterium]